MNRLSFDPSNEEFAMFDPHNGCGDDFKMIGLTIDKLVDDPNLINISIPLNQPVSKTLTDVKKLIENKRTKEFNFEFGHDSIREGLQFDFDLCDECQVEFIENFVGLN